MIARIFLSKDDDEHMPPLDSGKSITKEQKEILRKWIAQGAEYQGHWAFIAPERPKVPVHPEAKHPVDAFLTTRLQAEGLEMQEIAGKETLLRRASLEPEGYCYVDNPVPKFIQPVRATPSFVATDGFSGIRTEPLPRLSKKFE